ncbi:ABC transporter substrate-binding protein [Vallitalea okinawensis]|uniref:ABC transporter substrate-binding protein n=1 Tax=Vallitalea okinawensis TaxID=2078660 RepID=UPI0013003A76|nr:ABC transporter substrate-binding protein [Vallitalea okinawensis]
MKKILSLILVIVMMCSLLVGCGEQSASEETTEKTNQTEKAENKSNNETKTEPTKLVVWGGVPAESGPQDLVDAWNNENPDIQVEYVRFVNDDTGNTKLDTAILSGEQIDLFFTYTVDLLKKRVDSGMVESLEDAKYQDFIKENIAGEGEGMVLIDDQLYSIPTVREPFGIMLNKNMLDEKGITIPDGWTVDDYADVAKQLTGEKDGHTVYGANIIQGGGYPLDIPVTINGGDSYYNEAGNASNFDTPEFDASASLKVLMDEGYAMPYEEIFSRKLQVYAHPAFLSEEVAMTSFSAWMLRYVKDLENYPHDFVTTFAPYPTTENGVENNYQASLNNYICMNSNSDEKDAAWEFMKYWLTDGSKYMYKAGKISVWKEADPEEATKVILGDNAEELFDVEAYKAVIFNPDLEYIVDTITAGYPQLKEIYKEESEMYFLGETTKEEYLKNSKERSDKAIQAEIK